MEARARKLITGANSNQTFEKERIRGLFFLSIKSSIFIKKKKERVYRTYTREDPRTNKKREETYKPAQRDHILGIAIESIQKQSNKKDIHLRNETSPSKERMNNKKFQSLRRKSSIFKDNSIHFFPDCPKQA